MDCRPNTGAAPSALGVWGQELTLQLLGGKESSRRAPTRAGCPTGAPCLHSTGHGAGCGLVQLELPLHHRLAVSTEPSGHLSSRLGRGAAPSCQVPARQQGRGHGGQKEQLLLISDSVLQRAVCGCPLFLHFSLPSLFLISTKEQVNHRTREAQFFYFLVISRGLRVRDSF